MRRYQNWLALGLIAASPSLTMAGLLDGSGQAKPIVDFATPEQLKKVEQLTAEAKKRGDEVAEIEKKARKDVPPRTVFAGLIRALINVASGDSDDPNAPKSIIEVVGAQKFADIKAHQGLVLDDQNCRRILPDLILSAMPQTHESRPPGNPA